jgi:hypothetical protein
MRTELARFAGLPFERDEISPSQAHIIGSYAWTHLISGPARQTGGEIVSQRMLDSI